MKNGKTMSWWTMRRTWKTQKPLSKAPNSLTFGVAAMTSCESDNLKAMTGRWGSARMTETFEPTAIVVKKTKKSLHHLSASIWIWGMNHIMSNPGQVNCLWHWNCCMLTLSVSALTTVLNLLERFIIKKCPQEIVNVNGLHSNCKRQQSGVNCLACNSLIQQRRFKWNGL